MEDSKTFHPLEADAYNALVNGMCHSSQVLEVPSTDSLKQAGYTISREWVDVTIHTHWPSAYALLVRNDTQ